MSWILPRCFVAATFLVAALWTARATAQTQQWKTPGNPLKVDFTIRAPNRKLVLTDNGTAYSLPASLLLIGKLPIKIEAHLGEAGKFSVVGKSPKAVVEIQNVRSDGATGTAECQVKCPPPLDPLDAIGQARGRCTELVRAGMKAAQQDAKDKSEADKRAYIMAEGGDKDISYNGKPKEVEDEFLRCRAAAEVKGELVAKAEEMLGKKAALGVLKATEKADLRKRSGTQLISQLRLLLTIEILEEYLKACNLYVEPTAVEARAAPTEQLDKLMNLIKGVYLVRTGEADKLCENPRRDADPKAPGPGLRDKDRKLLGILSNSEKFLLRQAFDVELECHFYPTPDARDPNAEWFNAQRVACRPSGVSAVTVRGKLDPAAHDRIDWWILDGYDESRVSLSRDVPKNAAFAIDLPLGNEKVTAIRVIATGEAASEYSFELRPQGRSGSQRIEVHESAPAARAKFPF